MAAGTGAKRNGFVCPIMRTALAASVATVAKWISGAASLGVQVFRNGSLCSQGSRSRCKEKRFRVPDYENRTCSQRCSRCQMDFWGCSSGVAGCSGMAVCVVKGSRSRCKEKRLCVPDYENRTCSPCCSRCQMDFWGCSSGGAGCSGTAVCVVKGSWSRCKEKRFRVPDYENRTCSRCQMDFWGCFSGGAGVPERQFV